MCKGGLEYAAIHILILCRQIWAGLTPTHVRPCSQIVATLIVANCPDIGGTVTIFVSLSRVPPSAMAVPTFRNDWRSNWIRLYLELMSQRVRMRVSWPIIKYACAHYSLSTKYKYQYKHIPAHHVLECIYSQYL